jgi:hypothetical protein
LQGHVFPPEETGEKTFPVFIRNNWQPGRFHREMCVLGRGIRAVRRLQGLMSGLGLLLATAGSALAQDAMACEGGWVRVAGQCALPQDLTIGDEVEVSIGSAVSHRGVIVGITVCEGQRGYHTSARQTGCGWRYAITAYARRRTATTAVDDAAAGTALRNDDLQ